MTSIGELQRIRSSVDGPILGPEAIQAPDRVGPSVASTITVAGGDTAAEEPGVVV